MKHSQKQSRFVIASYLAGHMCNAPLFGIYTLLPFIMFNELQGSGLQITVLMAVKPVVAILSTYWSSLIANRSERIKANIVWGTILGVCPTLFLPFFHNNWFYIAAFAAYFFTERAVIPAWMELLKTRLSSEIMSRSVAKGSLICYIATAVIPVGVSRLFDHNIALWKAIFVVAGFFSLARILMLWWLPSEKRSVQKESFSLLQPWKRSLQLLQKRPDFAWYQLIFFFGGLGIMITQPAFPRFVGQVLQLSYTELAMAIAFAKGIGFLLTNSFWSKKIHDWNFHLFCSVVAVIAALSLLLIITSSWWGPGIYFSCFLYGVMQAGSQLSWQMAGPIFSGTEDSSLYTSVNILLVGIRGCIGPFLGGFIVEQFGLSFPYIVGSVLCCMGAICGLFSYYTNRNCILQF